MAITCQTYLDLVRSFLLTTGSASDHWPDTRMIPLVNQGRNWGQGEILQAYNTQFDFEEEIATDSSGNLAVPVDTIRVNSLERGALGSPLTRDKVTLILPTNRSRYRQGQQFNETWIVVGQIIKPQFATDTLGGRLYTLNSAKELIQFTAAGDAESANMSTRFLNLIGWYTTSLCLAMTEESIGSQGFEMRAMREAEKIRNEAANRALQTAQQIEDVMGYGNDEEPWPAWDN